jgi:hypothetical protein
MLVSGQKRWIFLPGIGSRGKAGNNGLLLQIIDWMGFYFATTLPELYDTMCSNRQNQPAEIAVKRLDRYQ